jgi:DUF971 family protein
MASSTPLVLTTSDPTGLEIEWDDGRRTRFTARQLREICPCAHCVDEATGIRVHDPDSVPEDLTQSDAELVGRYAIALRFSDGHRTGIYTFRMLRESDPETDRPD